MTDMILERTFEPPVSPADVLEMAGESGGCFALYRVDWNQSFLAPDGRRLLCWLSAPDAESARNALRQAGVGEDHLLWRGEVHDAATPDAPEWTAANVVVERSWEQPVELDEIQAIEDAGARCLETRQVRFARTFVSSDRKRMICLYQAPDAESVRQAQQQAGMPVDRVWACTQILEIG